MVKISANISPSNSTTETSISTINSLTLEVRVPEQPTKKNSKLFMSGNLYEKKPMQDNSFKLNPKPRDAMDMTPINSIIEPTRNLESSGEINTDGKRLRKDKKEKNSESAKHNITSPRQKEPTSPKRDKEPVSPKKGGKGGKEEQTTSPREKKISEDKDNDKKEKKHKDK